MLDCMVVSPKNNTDTKKKRQQSNGNGDAKHDKIVNTIRIHNNNLMSMRAILPESKTLV